MKVKLLKRNGFLWNITLFVLLSPFFLHVIKSLEVGRSAIDVQELIVFLESYKYLGIPIVLSFLAVINARKASLFFTGTYFIILVSLSFLSFLVELNKVILFMTMMFASVSYSFFLFLNDELKASFYRPGFSKFQLNETSSLPFKAVVTDKKSRKIVCSITNWDEIGCFIHFEDEIHLRGEVVINIEFEKLKFAQIGKVVTSYGNGYGIKFLQKDVKNAEIHSWKEFYSIINDRGYRPIEVGKVL